LSSGWEGFGFAGGLRVLGKAMLALLQKCSKFPRAEKRFKVAPSPRGSKGATSQVATSVVALLALSTEH